MDTKQKSALVGVSIIPAMLATTSANAALTLNTEQFTTDIATAETFGIAIGLAILGFVAVLALVKKARGAVK
ncbi:hypothetical protein [Acinetobacter sp. YH16032]|uniref:hypothetical protein n=1 Tax=Acinetobacter sp. YH16032 TaxID=2601181 RepID=UPI0015D1ED73|nr:hypothetical protein [Acinetobacter sp. YH16032]